jgi:hypothetical protein
VFSRRVAAAAFVAVIAVAATPVGPVALVAWPILAVQVYEDRRVNSLGRAWPSVVATLGPVAFPFYVRDRRKLVAALAAAPPPAELADGSPIELGAERPAAWYPDPAEKVRLRYWDGAAWTRHGAR